MGDKSGIEWTEATWNPVTGCSHVSDGCRFCYAETLTRRFSSVWGAPDLEWTAANAGANVILHPERLTVPLRWRRPRTVFVNSMSDLFHERIPDAFIARVFVTMALAQRHTFQVLTKRPERMSKLLGGAWLPVEVESWMDEPELPVPWPLPNVWLGVSIESRKHVDRADVLRATPAAHRFISAEPLLGPLYASPDERAWDSVRGVGVWGPDGYEGPELDLTDIDWLIAGGESGDHFAERPERFLVYAPNGGQPKLEALAWMRDLRDACEVAGTHFMLKQWGGRTPKSGGRELDGQTHDWVPPRAGELVA